VVQRRHGGGAGPAQPPRPRRHPAHGRPRAGQLPAHRRRRLRPAARRCAAHRPPRHRPPAPPPHRRRRALRTGEGGAPGPRTGPAHRGRARLVRDRTTGRAHLRRSAGRQHRHLRPVGQRRRARRGPQPRARGR
jgi:hypothetical protein